MHSWGLTPTVGLGVTLNKSDGMLCFVDRVCGFVNFGALTSGGNGTSRSPASFQIFYCLNWALAKLYNLQIVGIDIASSFAQALTILIMVKSVFG